MLLPQTFLNLCREHLANLCFGRPHALKQAVKVVL